MKETKREKEREREGRSARVTRKRSENNSAKRFCPIFSTNNLREKFVKFTFAISDLQKSVLQKSILNSLYMQFFLVGEAYKPAKRKKIKEIWICRKISKY